MRETVTITYLELPPGEAIRPPSKPAPAGFGTREVHDPAVNADLYRRVGLDYAWIDRLRWSDREWRRWAERVETHVVELDGVTTGYWELERESPTSAKIPIFGMLGEFRAAASAATRSTRRSPAVASWRRACG